MDLDLVMSELSDALDTIDGLRVAIVGEKPVPPAAYISYPESMDYHGTYGLGQHKMTLQAILIVGRTVDRSTRKALAAYCDSNDTASVKTALESGTYTSCDVVTVTGVDFDVVRLAAIDYMAAIFTVDVSGSGV